MPNQVAGPHLPPLENRWSAPPTPPALPRPFSRFPNPLICPSSAAWLGGGLGQPRGSAGVTHTLCPFVTECLPPQTSASITSEPVLSVAVDRADGSQSAEGCGAPTRRCCQRDSPASLPCVPPSCLPSLSSPTALAAASAQDAAQLPPPAWTPVRGTGDPSHGSATKLPLSHLLMESLPDCQINPCSPSPGLCSLPPGPSGRGRGKGGLSIPLPDLPWSPQ